MDSVNHNQCIFKHIAEVAAKECLSAAAILASSPLPLTSKKRKGVCVHGFSCATCATCTAFCIQTDR